MVWVPLAAVGTQRAKLASDFDPRTYGFRKLSDLVKKTNAFEIDHSEGQTYAHPGQNNLLPKKSAK